MTCVISCVNRNFGYGCRVRKNEVRVAVASNVVRLLRTEREKRGISMNLLAQRSGLSQSSISLIENNLRIPNLDTLLRITEVLEVNLGRVIQKAIQEATNSKAS